LNPASFLRELFDAALAAADPRLCVPKHLPKPPKGRTIVVGAGKAAASMARAVEENWQGDLSGLVVTRYGHGVPCERIEVVEAAHPVPDHAGMGAARRILSLVSGLMENDLVLFLGSGGGSALLSLPVDAVPIAEKQAITRALLGCGAPIGEINSVRKHLSSIKGGRLALAAYPARVHGLLISDVANDDPAVIASGPTVPDPTTREDALGILRAYRIDVSPAAEVFLSNPGSETPKPGDPRFDRVTNTIIATANDALDAASRAAERAGIRPVILDPAAIGEARRVAEAHARAALDTATAPCVLLSGGELTVTLNGEGRGGPNAEYLLALALGLDGAPGIWALACDTDGIDGSEDNAGAWISPSTLSGAEASGLDPREFLARNDAYGFFEKIAGEKNGGLVRTGPTRTNVNDFRAILISSVRPDC
jgi:glycerate 2-kinase